MKTTTRITCLAAAALMSVIAVSAEAPQGLYSLRDAASDSRCNWGRVEIAPGGEHELASWDGAGALTYFYITDGRGGITDPGLVLRIYWDGADYPSVNVPLAAFFGTFAGRVADWQSPFLSIRHNCHQSYFPMPFSKGMRITLYNDGPDSYRHDVAYNADVTLDAAYASEPSRFHAVWRRSNPTGGEHVILDVEGHGHYVGNILHVYTLSRRWWGEGDTDFTVDGRRIKHSPGTEDEYGACFDFGGPYSYLYSGYVLGGELVNEATAEYSYAGHNRAYRFYAANPVRFRRSLKVTLENQYVAPGTAYDFKGQQGASDDYTTVAYYYMEGAQPAELAPYSERTAPTKAVIY